MQQKNAYCNLHNAKLCTLMARFFVVKPFIQLFTIHGDLGSTASSNNILPLVYALLPNKKEKTYLRLFEMLKCRLPNWCPDQFRLHFETAIIHSIAAVYPNANIKGCYFHFAQALKKKATTEQNSGGLFARLRHQSTSCQTSGSV